MLVVRNSLVAGCRLHCFLLYLSKRKMKFILIILFIRYLSVAICVPSIDEYLFNFRLNKQTLILVDNMNLKDTHSEYLISLHERGYILTVMSADDPNLMLTRYGQYLFKNLIIFSPSVVDIAGGSITAQTIAKFIDDGGNLIVAANAVINDIYREIAMECGFELNEIPIPVIDHFNFDASDVGEHTKIVVTPKNLIKAPIIVGNNNTKPLLYDGTGMILRRDTSLVLPILTAASTAYTYDTTNQVRQYPHAVGNKIVLIGAMQARNNARVIFCGSLFFFSNEAFNSPVNMVHGEKLQSQRSGNMKLAVRLSEWALGQHGLLRVEEISHHLAGSDLIPSTYTITEDVVYRIKVEELFRGKWRPFLANDIQLEFVRIDPFVRVTLESKMEGWYEGTFKVPDVWGVYNFKVEYDRVGYTRLFNSTQVSVRPLQHTQYERFIPSAFPYYVSAFSMMVGVYLFAFVFLYYEEDKFKTT